MSLDAAHCFRAFGSTVYRWAFALLGRADDAQDVTQDVFLRLLREQLSFEHAAPARAWLRTTTTNVVVDRARAGKARRRRESAALALPPPVVDSIDSEWLPRLRSAFTSLSDQQRLVLICKCYDDMTFAEIASELNLGLSTVKTHYLRALETLRQELKAAADEDVP